MKFFCPPKILKTNKVNICNYKIKNRIYNYGQVIENSKNALKFLFLKVYRGLLGTTRDYV